tara:strand:- start:380 stop:598 length:219 start_codon:yes stop_codon:yes gene_type:complete
LSEKGAVTEADIVVRLRQGADVQILIHEILHFANCSRLKEVLWKADVNLSGQTSVKPAEDVYVIRGSSFHLD